MLVVLLSAGRRQSRCSKHGSRDSAVVPFERLRMSVDPQMFVLLGMRRFHRFFGCEDRWGLPSPRDSSCYQLRLLVVAAQPV